MRSTRSSDTQAKPSGSEHEIVIRPVAADDHAGLKACEELQRLIWGAEPIQIVPDHLLITAIENGGLLLMAYHAEEPIGFAFSFPGLQDKTIKHCSLMAGVLSAARYRGVGYRLKLAQREHILQQDLELITWTFDPLQSANARFNLHKLGALPVRYQRDFYGEMRDELNRGLPSDRLFIEWWLNSPRVLAKIERRYRLPTIEDLLAHGARMINRTEMKAGWLTNVSYSLDLDAPQLLVEIPTNTPQMKREEPELTRRWRLETREIFERYLARNYWITEFLLADRDGQRRGYYLLERRTKEEILDRDGLSP